MQKIEVIQLSISDLQRMLDLAVEKAIKAYQESQKQPSQYEELTLRQAADELGCCEATVRRKMIQLNIQGSRVGKFIKIQRFLLARIKKG